MPRGDGRKSGERRDRYVKPQALQDLAKSHTPKLERRIRDYTDSKLNPSEGFNKPGSQK